MRAPPTQVFVPLCFAQWQAFAKRGLVDLDHADAGFFRGPRLPRIASCDLKRGRGTRLIVAHERPLQNGHGASQHAFDRFARRFVRTGQSTVIASGRHRRRKQSAADAARAAHPAVLGEREAEQLLAECSTMSLRSASPCTSTSSPSNSCCSMANLISPRIASR